jgi:CheY-like chemotaxis protein
MSVIPEVTAMPATILVVDDDEAIVDLVATILWDAGYGVLCAYGGRQALARLERGGIDLVITDNMMPEVGGLALLASLRARPDPAVPSILMSAVRPATPPPPPTVFLPKPFDLDDLLALVSAVLTPR